MPKYKDFDELIQGKMWEIGKKGKPFTVAQICQTISKHPIYIREAEFQGGATFEDSREKWEHRDVPKRVSDQLKKPTVAIPYPDNLIEYDGNGKEKKSSVLGRFRQYSAFRLFGAWYYCHYWYVNAEIAKLQLRNKAQKTVENMRQEWIWRRFVDQLVENNCTGAEVDTNELGRVLASEMDNLPTPQNSSKYDDTEMDLDTLMKYLSQR